MSSNRARSLADLPPVRYADATSTKVEIIAVGDECGIILPDDLLARMQINVGDELFAVPTHEGFKLVPAQRGLARLFQIARYIMLRRKSALNALAKY